MNSPRLVVFTRFPVPGEVKTRLVPLLGPNGAAALHRRLTEHTLTVARGSGLSVEVRITGADPKRFADWLGEDACYLPQGEGDLGARLRRAGPPYPVLFVGSDLPDLSADHLTEAARRLEKEQVVIGPAVDGGYWLLGLSRPCDLLFHDMDWGTERVFAETCRRLEAQGITPSLLPVLADCDRPEDLRHWPELQV
jgi:rSAM/selenodomain-associated transferase 1